MRLKSIKLSGFKSFAEPTRLDFPDPVICIVGPNGCGKSNTLDAIRWVMGESTARALRGGEMNDVLFNGTDRRKPVSQCSVELLFDNSDHRLKGAWNRYAELSVRRVHHREQGSQYYLNGQRCRRRDIATLFDGTGLGPRSYALIGQGNISHIIEARPEQLRQFLEEAAGVGYYRQRRRETLSRLEATEENLAQLQVQRHSWAEQLEQLEAQSASAQRHEALTHEIDQLTRWRFQLKHQQLVERIESLEAELVETQRQHGAQLLAVESLQKELLIEERRLPQRRDEVGALQREMHALDKALALKQAEREQLQQRHDQLNDERNRLVQQLAQTRSALEATHDEQMRSELAHRPQMRAQLAQVSHQLAQLAQQLVEAETTLEQARQTETRRRQEHERLHQALLEKQQRQQQLEYRLSQQRAQMDELLIRQRQLAIDEDTRLCDAAETRLSALQAQLRSLAQALDVRRAEQAGLEQRVHELRQAHQSLSAEKAQLEAELRGLVQAQSRLVPLLDNPQADGRGILEQIQVRDPDWQDAIESWLGHRLRGIEWDGWPDTLPESVPFVGVAMKVEEPPVAPPVPGWRPLLELLRAPLSIQHLARNIWCSETHPTPQQLKKLSGAQAVLTPDGCLWWPCAVERLHTDLSGAIARQQRMDQLRRQIQVLTDRVDEVAQQLTRQSEALNAHAEETERMTRQQVELSEQARAQAVELEKTRNRLELHRRAYQALDEQISRLRQQLEDDEANLKALVERVTPERDRLDDARTLLEQSRLQQEQAQARISELRQQQHPLQQRKAELERRLEQLDRMERHHQQEQAGLRARIQQLEQSLEHVTDQIDALPDRSAQDEAIRRMDAQLHQAHDRLKAARSDLARHEQRLARLRERLKSAEKQAYALHEKLSTSQLAQEQAQHGLHQLVQEAEAAGLTLALLRQAPLDAPDLKSVERRLRTALKEREALGPVNMTAISALAELRGKMTRLDEQVRDIQQAVETLQQSIRRIDRDSRHRLRQTFDRVNEHFARLFPVIFRGGQAQLRWLEPDGDPLDNGVLVMAQPPGKRTARIQMLSGGEKTLTALALIFALFELNPAPFCVLDEVDAPLDDANVARFCDLVKSMSKRVQFLIITHNKTTMTMADRLLGVTMHEPGVSRVVSVDIRAAVDMIEETG